KRADRERCVAVLDFETDPFDNGVRNGVLHKNLQARIFPFLAVLYSDQFDHVVIWEEDFTSFVEKVLAVIASLPEAFTIYAHNGGAFDYMFFIEKLRGAVKFKGRGMMRAVIPGKDGIEHELRDSKHIIPAPLAEAAGKMKFGYDKMKKSKRHKHREKI